MDPRITLVFALLTIFLVRISDAALNLVDLNIDQIVRSVGATGQSADGDDPAVVESNVLPIVGESALYDMSGFDSLGAPLDLYLQVELLSFTNVGLHRIEFGQSRTGLLGIEIINGNGSTQNLSATYRFSFFEQDGDDLGNAFTLDTIMQTRDIDLVERVTVGTSQFVQYGLSGNTTLSGSEQPGFLTIGGINENTDKANSNAAVNFYGQNIAAFDVLLEGLSMGANSGREFQFDFKNPPSLIMTNEFITPVPEPMTFSLLLGGVVMLLAACRRQR